VKTGVTTDILVKTASNEINGSTKKDAIILWEDQTMWVKIILRVA
jgi:hypothetical protein